MKKLIFSILLISTLLLSACSKEADTTAFPDDLVVVLPDGQELALYMPHDDAAEILGPADSVDDILEFGHNYSYENLGLDIGYKDDLLVSIWIDESSPCSLKNGLSPSSTKSDFVEEGFTEETLAFKYYSINDGHYIHEIVDLYSSTKAPFQSAAMVCTLRDYSTADSPNFDGYPMLVADYYCNYHGWD